MPIFHRLKHALVILVALVAASVASFAQNADEAFTRLAADSYSDTSRAIEILVSRAHPNAALIVEALGDGRLLAGPSGVVVKSTVLTG